MMWAKQLHDEPYFTDYSPSSSATARMALGSTVASLPQPQQHQRQARQHAYQPLAQREGYDDADL